MHMKVLSEMQGSSKVKKGLQLCVLLTNRLRILANRHCFFRFHYIMLFLQLLCKLYLVI